MIFVGEPVEDTIKYVPTGAKSANEISEGHVGRRGIWYKRQLQLVWYKRQ